MKYLRKFYESVDLDIIQDIKDILLELTDRGFELMEEPNHKLGYLLYYISNLKFTLKWDDIEDSLRHLYDYAKLNNLDIETHLNGTELKLKGESFEQLQMGEINPHNLEFAPDYYSFPDEEVSDLMVCVKN